MIISLVKVIQFLHVFLSDTKPLPGVAIKHCWGCPLPANKHHFYATHEELGDFWKPIHDVSVCPHWDHKLLFWGTQSIFFSSHYYEYLLFVSLSSVLYIQEEGIFSLCHLPVISDRIKFKFYSCILFTPGVLILRSTQFSLNLLFIVVHYLWVKGLRECSMMWNSGFLKSNHGRILYIQSEIFSINKKNITPLFSFLCLFDEEGFIGCKKLSQISTRA